MILIQPAPDQRKVFEEFEELTGEADKNQFILNLLDIIKTNADLCEYYVQRPDFLTLTIVDFLTPLIVQTIISPEIYNELVIFATRPDIWSAGLAYVLLLTHEDAEEQGDVEFLSQVNFAKFSEILGLIAEEDEEVKDYPCSDKIIGQNQETIDYFLPQE